MDRFDRSMVLKMIMVMFQYRFVSKSKVKENIRMASGFMKHTKSHKCTLVDVGNYYKSKDRDQTFNFKSVTTLKQQSRHYESLSSGEKTTHC